MFRLLGTAVSKAWPILLLGWIGLTAWSALAAPKWDDVAEGGQFAFLPKDAPSNRADELLKQAFPDEPPASNIVLVLSREDEGGLRDEDRVFIIQVLKPTLQQAGQASGRERQGEAVRRIRSLADQGEGELLRSADNKATLVVMELAGEFMTSRDWPLIEKVEHLTDDLRREQKVPQGLEIALTGNAVIGRDVRLAERQSADKIGRWTIIVVVALLLIIYRAPLAAILPLATVFVSVTVSVNALAILAQHHYVEVSETVRIYITVLSYGAGVDYCVFLIARYREELDRGIPSGEAVARAVHGVGGAICASAGTVICGIATLLFTRFGKYHEAGICIPLSLCVVLAAALTFTPALLRIAGSWTFWPSRPRAGTSPSVESVSIWERVARTLQARPGFIWLASVAAMTPFVAIAVLHYNEVDYGVSTELPKGAPGRAGLQALKKHFPAGTVGPVTVLLTNEKVTFGAAESYGLLRAMNDSVQQQAQALQIADIRSLAYPFGITPYGKGIVASISASAPPASGEALQHSSYHHYVSTAPGLKGHVTRIDLVSKIDPLSQAGIENLPQVENAVWSTLPAELRDSQVAFSGPTAALRDLQDVTQRDFQRIEILVPVVVFGILLLLLRSLATSLYLIASVVFSYLATLGVTFLVFRYFNPEGFVGLDWKVPTFLFTILVAVGEDYNIFLLTRVREEEREHGPLHGITTALIKTGGVISTCGIIMAGTFATLWASSLIETKQMGFALAFGVLLDTLLVRPVLVPAFLIWTRRRSEMT